MGQSGHAGYYRTLRTKISDFLATEKGKNFKWAEILVTAPDFFYLLSRLMGDPRVAPAEKAKLGIALAYFISPIDVIPEIVVGPVGFLDDIALTAWILQSALQRTDPKIIEEHWPGNKAALETIQKILHAADQMFTRRVWQRIQDRIRRKG